MEGKGEAAAYYQVVSLGIDLGNMNSRVGIVRKDGRIEVIVSPNEIGNKSTPSYICFYSDHNDNDHNVMIGESAKMEYGLNPENTVFNVKRLIGCRCNDLKAKEDVKRMLFKVNTSEAAGDKFCIQVKYKGETKDFLPEEISAMILQKMKDIAQEFLGCSSTTTIQNVVVTVPSNFNNAQRQATKDAAMIAGLNLLRLANESTATAIAYALSNNNYNHGSNNKQIAADEEKNILIFSLGGGSFDVSVVTVSSDLIIEVKAVCGDTHLGGQDFNNQLVDYFVREFKRKHGVDPTTHSKAIARLRNACERAKRTLSRADEANIEIESFMNGTDYHSSITRLKFEELNVDLFDYMLLAIENVISEAKMDKRDIDEIVLTGGSSRIPKIRQLVSQYFNNKLLYQDINPDEAAVYGAAVQAAVLGGMEIQDPRMNEILTIDLLPFALTVKTCQVDGLTEIFRKGTPIPCQSTKIYKTVADDQRTVSIKIFAGSYFLGDYSFIGIAPAPKGVLQIHATFSIDSNGILSVSAYVPGSWSIQTTNNRNRFTREEIENMTKKVQELSINCTLRNFH